MNTFKKELKESLKDPEFKKLWDADEGYRERQKKRIRDKWEGR